MIKKWKYYAFWIVVCELVGLLSAYFSMDGMEHYNAVAVQPSFAPPDWLFPIVWTILFALMGISAARISILPRSRERSMALNVFVAQLVVNFFWPLLFFNAFAFGFAFFWLLLLWGLVLWMILLFRKLDAPAAWLQIPYLIWLTFAAVLNAVVWLLNK